jgi:hypothetical protein
MNYNKHYNSKHHDAEAELRDIFAALAMQSLIDAAVTPKWVANQAYKYADAMLEIREEASLTDEKKTTITNT